MATVTGLTKARMLAIEASCIVDGDVVADHLILTKHDGSTIDAGNVKGDQGPMGLGPGMIPGEVRMWPGTTLPAEDPYSLWVWANGGSYLIADHPIAADHIHDNWRTFGGLSDPGGSYFRVPDLRGLVPAGMDQMPSGGSANRVVRSTADQMAGKLGEETHVLTEAEMPSHDHDFRFQNLSMSVSEGTDYIFFPRDSPDTRDDLINDRGGDAAHENLQPTVFIGYIVCLDSA